MSLYTYLDARQQFDHLFDEAKEKRSDDSTSKWRSVSSSACDDI